MAEVALFVHSTGTGPFMWTKLLAQRPEGLTPLTPSNRGYSLADMVPRGQPLTLADEVAHLRAQIPDGTTALHLGGHSYGGLAALTLALDSTLPVRSVWLYEPVLFGALRAEMPTLPEDAAADVRGLFDGEHSMLDDKTGGLAPWLANPDFEIGPREAVAGAEAPVEAGRERPGAPRTACAETTVATPVATRLGGAA